MQLCKYVFPIGYHYMCPKGTTLREYASVDVSHVKISSTAWALGRLKDFCIDRNIKKLSGNFGYMGRSNPWGDLDQMWRVRRCGGHNHVCNIWWLSVRGCGVVRGVILPSPIDLMRRPYNTGHVWCSDTAADAATSLITPAMCSECKTTQWSNIWALLKETDRWWHLDQVICENVRCSLVLHQRWLHSNSERLNIGDSSAKFSKKNWLH